MFADQRLPVVAQIFASVPVYVENGRIVVQQKEGIGRLIGECAKPRFACAYFPLRLSQLGDVLHHPKLAQRFSRLIPGHIPLAVNCSLGAIGADHPVFDVVAWTAGQYCSRSGIGHSRLVLGMNQSQPTPVPLRQVERFHPENAAGLFR